MDAAEATAAFEWFLAETMQVPPGFFSSLEGDSDWAFVIKLHALIESALIHLLTAHFQDERLREVFIELENSSPTRGRLAFVRVLELLPKDCITFIGAFSKLRNLLAHKHTNVGFSFAQSDGAFNKDIRANFRKVMLPLIANEPEITDIASGTTQTLTKEELWDRHPRMAFLAAVTGPVDDLQHRTHPRRKQASTSNDSRFSGNTSAFADSIQRQGIRREQSIVMPSSPASIMTARLASPSATSPTYSKFAFTRASR